MNYDEEIAKLYKQIQDLKTWLLQNTPSINELEQMKKKYDAALTALTQKITSLEQKIKLLGG